MFETYTWLRIGNYIVWNGCLGLIEQNGITGRDLGII